MIRKTNSELIREMLASGVVPQDEQVLSCVSGLLRQRDELLAALKRLLEQFGTHTESEAWETSDQEEYDLAQAAIAKVEGRK
jgi:hypothetical protein